MKDHYVEKSGYWIYDSITKTLTHSDMYPYFNVVLYLNYAGTVHVYPIGNAVKIWIYVDGPGVIQVKNDVIFKFIPQTDSFDDLDKNELKCWVHKPKEYIGFTERYFYCTVCGTKL